MKTNKKQNSGFTCPVCESNKPSEGAMLLRYSKEADENFAVCQSCYAIAHEAMKDKIFSEFTILFAEEAYFDKFYRDEAFEEFTKFAKRDASASLPRKHSRGGSKTSGKTK